jgi:predicted enzyme related to lactoylglutathione lyase
MIKDHNPVGWFEIYVQDIERAKAFYQNTLQVQLERHESPDLEMWAFPMLHGHPGCTGALVKMPGKDSGGGGTIIYFLCEDCAVEAARAAEHGGTIERPKFPIGEYGFITFVIDTEGNRIGLHSMK